MNEFKVIDINTKKGVIFNKTIREDAARVIRGSGVAPDTAEEVVTQIEQVICTAIVGVARTIAEKLAAKVFKTFFAQSESSEKVAPSYENTSER